MADEDLLRRPATALAEMVRDGELAAAELTELSLRRIERLNPQLNAFVDIFGDEALAQAQKIAPGDRRPFAGVPIAIKNNRPIAGKRLTLGSELTGDIALPYDSGIVERIVQAGFVIVGTTTLPEWGIMATTEARRFGPTRNPWNLDRTPGGSSGGSAAAVAAGVVPLAHGNDGGGSLRIPAACCGLVGLKPTRGRISGAPDQGESFLVVDGVLTRTVAETATMLDLLSGPVPGDASWAPPPNEPFATAAEHLPRRLKIAATAMPPLEADLDPQALSAFVRGRELLEQLGHEVIAADPPWRRPDVLDQFTAVFGPALCTQMAMLEKFHGRDLVEDDVEALSWAMWNRCRALNSVDAALAASVLQRFAREVVVWCADYDAILTPSLAEPPLPLGVMTTDDRSAPMAGFERSARFTPFTAICNITGQPAISLPLTATDDGLPLGIQLIGRPTEEGRLLALATQIERAAPWDDRIPTLFT